MADTKISALTAASAAAGANEIPINEAGTTKKVTVSQILATGATPPNLLKNGNFINNSTNGYGSTPDDWTSSNANPVQGGFPALTKQNLIDMLGVADGDIEGLWNLNEASGNATDLSSNAYHLTDTNTVGASNDGLMGKARDFEFSNNEYFTGTAANCGINGDKTVFALIKPEGAGSVPTIFYCNSTGSRYDVVYSASSGVLLMRHKISTALTSLVTSDVKLENGKWYFICAVFATNGTSRLWINGVKKSASNGTFDSHSGTVTVDIGFDGGSDYFDGLIQNAGVLSVALTDNQVKKLFAATLYKGQKIRRATTNAYQYQQLPQDLVERLRGKTVALRAEMYQDTASTGQISIHQTMADSTTDETIISATDATTGSWLTKSCTGTLEADVVTIEIRLKHSTSDGNTWFKKVSLYEGSVALPYDHSKDDWSRFPRLLQMSIPSLFNGAFPYQYEEKRFYTRSVTISYTAGASPSNVSYSNLRWMFSGKSCVVHDYLIFGTAGTTVTTINIPIPVHLGLSTSGQVGGPSTVANASTPILSKMQQDDNNFQFIIGSSTVDRFGHNTVYEID